MILVKGNAPTARRRPILELAPREQSHEMLALVVTNVGLQQTYRWYICVSVRLRQSFGLFLFELKNFVSFQPFDG